MTTLLVAHVAEVDAALAVEAGEESIDVVVADAGHGAHEAGVLQKGIGVVVGLP